MGLQYFAQANAYLVVHRAGRLRRAVVPLDKLVWSGAPARAPADNTLNYGTRTGKQHPYTSRSRLSVQ